LEIVVGKICVVRLGRKIHPDKTGLLYLLKTRNLGFDHCDEEVFPILHPAQVMLRSRSVDHLGQNHSESQDNWG